MFNNVQTKGIVKASGFTRGVCNIKFEGFSSGILRKQAILRKSKAPRKSPENWTFLSLEFYNVIIILTTPTPHISQKYAPKIRHKMRGRMA